MKLCALLSHKAYIYALNYFIYPVKLFILSRASGIDHKLLQTQFFMNTIFLSYQKK